MELGVAKPAAVNIFTISFKQECFTRAAQIFSTIKRRIRSKIQFDEAKLMRTNFKALLTTNRRRGASTRVARRTTDLVAGRSRTFRGNRAKT